MGALDDEIGHAVGEDPFEPTLLEELPGFLLGDREPRKAAERVGDDLPADEPGLVEVGVVFHLPGKVAGEGMSDPHQAEEDPAREPDTPSREAEDHADPQTAPLLPLLEPYVPGVALPDDAGKPAVDAVDEGAEAHPGALGEVAEFMREDAGKLLDRHPCREWQTDRQHQVVARETRQAAPVGRRGVDLQIDVNSLWQWGSDRRTDPVHEGEQRRLVPGAEGVGLGVLWPACQEWLHHEGHEDSADDCRGDVGQNRHGSGFPAELVVGEHPDVVHQMPPHSPADAEDHRHVDQRQEDHHHPDQRQGETVAERRPHRTDIAGDQGHRLGWGEWAGRQRRRLRRLGRLGGAGCHLPVAPSADAEGSGALRALH